MKSLMQFSIPGSRIFLILASLVFITSLTGCLTAEKKVMMFTVNPDGSGSGKIVYMNIQSLQEDDQDRTLNDYSTLINDWVEGEQFQKDHPTFTNVQVKLSEIGNSLHGEITFDFPHYIDVGLYRYSDNAPWMYYALRETGSYEFFDTTDGEFVGNDFPVIVWPAQTTEFRIINTFDRGERPSTPLLSFYKKFGTSLPEEPSSK